MFLSTLKQLYIMRTKDPDNKPHLTHSHPPARRATSVSPEPYEDTTVVYRAQFEWRPYTGNVFFRAVFRSTGAVPAVNRVGQCPFSPKPPTPYQITSGQSRKWYGIRTNGALLPTSH